MGGDTLHKIDPRGDVAPLITPSHLADASEALVQVQEVVRLQTLVGELGEAHAVL